MPAWALAKPLLWNWPARVISEDKLTALVEESGSLSGSIHAYPLDVTNQQAVNKVVTAILDTFSTIDQAVLNAGTYLPMPGSKFKAVLNLPIETQSNKKTT